MTNEEIERLKEFNYVRRAPARDNYWVDFSKKKLENIYCKKYKDGFNIVIHSGPDLSYYSIPYFKVKQLFVNKSLAKSSDGRLRWIGTIDDHFLKFTNLPPVNIKPYYVDLDGVQQFESQKEQAELERFYRHKSRSCAYKVKIEKRKRDDWKYFDSLSESP